MTSTWSNVIAANFRAVASDRIGSVSVRPDEQYTYLLAGPVGLDPIAIQREAAMVVL